MVGDDQTKKCACVWGNTNAVIDESEKVQRETRDINDTHKHTSAHGGYKRLTNDKIYRNISHRFAASMAMIRNAVASIPSL